ncbi:hypothetical protein H6G74_09260 [Nostoc spongiaeforme FACHB-130]|uniref:Uncharacterized protein n=1 Tax=Nostoc spongiaeforme FACHB-130 TaxID=1357510 RepID=A0ABR8FTY8_9NOSO|nr:hypothetical protein [Nostoc spongiaeforme]MBD2594513.1 hypothetical protein [Nostoc spongiaeforme FACHB-130]
MKTFIQLKLALVVCTQAAFNELDMFIPSCLSGNDEFSQPNFSSFA